MLISIALISLSGLLMGRLCKKISFPPLFGMILAGIIIGPYVLNLLDTAVLDISADIRRIAKTYCVDYHFNSCRAQARYLRFKKSRQSCFFNVLSSSLL